MFASTRVLIVSILFTAVIAGTNANADHTHARSVSVGSGLGPVPPVGNPCTDVCYDNVEAASSGECALCCRSATHRTSWNCPTQSAPVGGDSLSVDVNHGVSAACCSGAWTSECWATPSVDNFFHACDMCNMLPPCNSTMPCSAPFAVCSEGFCDCLTSNSTDYYNQNCTAHASCTPSCVGGSDCTANSVCDGNCPATTTAHYNSACTAQDGTCSPACTGGSLCMAGTNQCTSLSSSAVMSSSAAAMSSSAAAVLSSTSSNAPLIGSNSSTGGSGGIALDTTTSVATQKPTLSSGTAIGIAMAGLVICIAIASLCWCFCAADKTAEAIPKSLPAVGGGVVVELSIPK